MTTVTFERSGGEPRLQNAIDVAPAAGASEEQGGEEDEDDPDPEPVDQLVEVGHAPYYRRETPGGTIERQDAAGAPR